MGSWKGGGLGRMLESAFTCWSMKRVVCIWMGVRGVKAWSALHLGKIEDDFLANVTERFSYKDKGEERCCLVFERNIIQHSTTTLRTEGGVVDVLSKTTRFVLYV